jgi:hypothetical protein
MAFKVSILGLASLCFLFLSSTIVLHRDSIRLESVSRALIYVDRLFVQTEGLKVGVRHCNSTIL